MSKEESKVNENRDNPIMNPKEWVDPIKWFAVLIVGIIMPLILLSFFWVLFSPPFNIFLTITTVYTLLAGTLILGVFKEKKQ